jgi:hypothetical protein
MQIVGEAEPEMASAVYRIFSPCHLLEETEGGCQVIQIAPLP